LAGATLIASEPNFPKHDVPTYGLQFESDFPSAVTLPGCGCDFFLAIFLVARRAVSVLGDRAPE